MLIYFADRLLDDLIKDQGLEIVSRKNSHISTNEIISDATLAPSFCTGCFIEYSTERDSEAYRYNGLHFDYRFNIDGYDALVEKDVNVILLDLGAERVEGRNRPCYEFSTPLLLRELRQPIICRIWTESYNYQFARFVVSFGLPKFPCENDLVLLEFKALLWRLRVSLERFYRERNYLVVPVVQDTNL